MVLDFDVKTFCQNLRATKPPYECPVKNCGKIYKSFCGIQFHLYNYDHDNPTSQHSAGPPKVRRKKGRWHPRANRRSPTPPEQNSQTDLLRFTEAQKTVEIDLDGHVHELDISEPLEFLFYEGPMPEMRPEEEKPKDEKPEKVPKSQRGASQNRKDTQPAKETKLPEASFKILDDYNPPDAPPMPISYCRFIEKSAEELDEEVEYDMDEEDCAWLDIMNGKRSKENLGEVSVDTFELLMDRLEKESYFQSQNSGKDPSPSIDEDAVCCICNDGECQNSNAILFCDMCNLAVHQECYGVPYIPEGQWLCRRCLQSPSRAVDCVLCPNKGGAFKQTHDGRWAHVVCALWIPEVCFANTVFLEPLDNIENIPPARWKLTCYICKQRSVGACIQCHKANCYTAFHVTCAQQAGLHMKMEAIRDSGINGTSYNVRKTAYCDVHTPVDADNSLDDDGGRTDSYKKAKAKAKSREKMRKARKILAEKRSAIPVVSLPTIPPDGLTKISSLVFMAKKQYFLDRLLAYWTLKRQSRNGVPLLRRLQTAQTARRDPELDKETGPLGEQLQYWQRLRQDLEKARLLVELIRKREKLKREFVRAHQIVVEMQIQPLIVKLREVVEQLQEKDINLGEIFAKPVDLIEVPDYLDYIKNPMDLETMMNKVNSYKYASFDNFEDDFNLMIKNCTTYNSKDTVFYKAALKMREQGGSVLRDARMKIELAGFDFSTGLLNPDGGQRHSISNTVKKAVKVHSSGSESSKNVENEISLLEEQLKVAMNKLEATSKIKHSVARGRRAKILRMEILKLRRRIAMKSSAKRRWKRQKVEDIDPEHSDSTESSSLVGHSRTRSSVKKSDFDITSSESSIAGTTWHTKRNSKDTADLLEPKKEENVKDSNIASTANSESLTSSPTRNRRHVPVKDTNESLNDEGPRPVGRPGRRGHRRFRKNSTPPPSLPSSEKEHELKPVMCSPPELLNASTSLDTLHVRKHGRLAQSQDTSPKGTSPPILKPQVLLTGQDNKKINSTDTSEQKNNDSVPHGRTRGRLHRPSGATPTKSKMGDMDLKEEDEDNSVNDIEIRGKPSRSQSRSLSESDSGSVTPQKNLRKSRLSGSNADGDMSPGKKRGGGTSGPVDSTQPFPNTVPQTDSFKVYRSSSQDHATDSDNNTETSSESVRSSSGSSSDISSDDESDVEGASKKVDTSSENQGGSHKSSSNRNSVSMEWNAEEQQHLIPLQPLDLVWAKCRGYPWYPALIISPEMSSAAHFHNGVPIPMPPKEVLALKENYTEDVFLVLFFDTKRTWQWLPRDKLAPLGVDSALDKARLVESKKAAERKAVKKAFENAILHRCRVTGESTSISGESSNDN